MPCGWAFTHTVCRRHQMKPIILLTRQMEIITCRLKTCENNIFILKLLCFITLSAALALYWNLWETCHYLLISWKCLLKEKCVRMSTTCRHELIILLRHRDNIGSNWSTSLVGCWPVQQQHLWKSLYLNKYGLLAQGMIFIYLMQAWV